LIFNILPGLFLAVLLSLILLIYNASQPEISILGKAPGKDVYGDIQRHPENEQIPGLLISRLDAPLFFANDALLSERLKELVHTIVPRPRAVLLDMETNGHLDISSLDTLTELASDLQAQGASLELANVRGPVHDMLQQGGFMRAVGEGHIYSSIQEGVDAFKHEKSP
jgi:MFS superfamily sulfate permease-like transporter